MCLSLCLQLIGNETLFFPKLLGMQLGHGLFFGNESFIRGKFLSFLETFYI